MTQFQSTYGLPYSASSQQQVSGFEAAITSYLASATDTMTRLDTLLESDPDMLMAHCFRGYLLKLAAHPQFAAPIQGCIDEANRVLQMGLGHGREKQHVQALTLWVADQTDAALATLEDLLKVYPLDMLALRIAHYIHFYNGRGDQMCDSTGRVMSSWTTDHPHYGYLQGMHAFGLEESGQYAQALEFGKRAVDLNAADIWATHAVAHVHLMQDQHAQGLDWLRGLIPNFSDTNNFRYHVDWHEALHLLGLGEPAEALALYDERLADSVADDFYLDVCNNAALLWRLEFLGIDVGERWQVLVQCAEKHVRDQELLFASLHYLIPLVATGSTQAEVLRHTIDQWSDMNTGQGAVCAKVGRELASALVESAQAPEHSAQLLAEHFPQVAQIGGSHAQRDLFRLLGVHNAHLAQRDDLVAALNAH